MEQTSLQGWVLSIQAYACCASFKDDNVITFLHGSKYIVWESMRQLDMQACVYCQV